MLKAVVFVFFACTPEHTKCTSTALPAIVLEANQGCSDVLSEAADRFSREHPDMIIGGVACWTKPVEGSKL